MQPAVEVGIVVVAVAVAVLVVGHNNQLRAEEIASSLRMKVAVVGTPAVVDIPVVVDILVAGGTPVVAGTLAENVPSSANAGAAGILVVLSSQLCFQAHKMPFRWI